MVKSFFALFNLGLLLMASTALGDSGLDPAQVTSTINTGDTAWMLTASAFVLLMTPGLSFFYGGLVQPKNIVSTMAQSFICLGLISVVWVVVGYSLAFGESIGGIIGNPLDHMFLNGIGLAPDRAFAPTFPLLLFAFFQMKFAVITPALITGAFAERITFKACIVFTILFSFLIYAPLAHWTWHPDGLLHQLGVIDFAGGTVVHISAGFAALGGSLVLGPRRQLVTESYLPAQVPYVLLGTGLLWFGWFGFNAGSAFGANERATLAFATTQSASAIAGITWMLYDVILGRKPGATGVCLGAIVGLVAITPAAGYVTIGSSLLIGMIASIISHIVMDLGKKYRFDDTLDVFACHGVGGMVGMVMTGILAQNVGLAYGPTKVFTAHMIALLVVPIFCFFGSALIFWIMKALIPLRVTPEDEALGLDYMQHGERTIPLG